MLKLMVSIKIIPLALIWSVMFAAGQASSSAGSGDIARQKAGIKIHSTEEIENSLLALANRSRLEAGLEPLRSLQALTETAERHSRDMARQGKTNHISEDGRSLADRLKESGLFFASSGENVAFSETFVAEFIHDSFMTSPEHRENLLDPEFNRAGIGVIQVEGKGYYITQNFLQTLNPGLSPDPLVHEPLSFWGRVGFQAGLRKRVKGLRTELIRRVGEVRGNRGLPPLQLIERVDAFAGRLASLRLSGRELPPVPDSFGISHIIFLSAPTLVHLGGELGNISFEDYIQGGLDIRFGRNADHPGGGLFVTLVLFPESERIGNKPEAQHERLEGEIQALRDSRGLPPLRLEKSLSYAALKISQRLKENGRADRFPPGLASYRVTSYVTRDLHSIPESLRSRLTQKGIRRIGIGISSAGGEELPAGHFWVTVIYR